MKAVLVVFFCSVVFPKKVGINFGTKYEFFRNVAVQ